MINSFAASCLGLFDPSINVGCKTLIYKQKEIYQVAVGIGQSGRNRLMLLSQRVISG